MMSMFSQTCQRLREYLKDRPEASSAIIDLFPANTTMMPRSGDFVADQSSMPKPMTFFYGGRVIVLEDVSSNTAEQVMRIAAGLTSSSSPSQSPSSLHMSSNSLHAADLSQMRTQSLTRFLEKRKDRTKSRSAPYTSRNKQQVDKSWLSLSAANQ